MKYPQFKASLELLLKQYPSYQPDAGFFQHVRSLAHGHGRTGYERKERLASLLVEKENNLLNRCVEFYLQEIKDHSARGSWLMKHLAQILKDQLRLNENNLRRYSPLKLSTAYLGACDGALCVDQYDTEQGFHNYLKQFFEKQKQLDAPKPEINTSGLLLGWP